MGRVLSLAPMAVPTLDEVASNPERATALPAGTLQGLLCRCATVQTVLLGALLTASARTGADAAPEPETLLDIGEAAKRLATTRDWLYRHAGRLPFTVRNGRQLRFSARGIARYIRERQGLGTLT
jgi:hypothetical protein